MAKVFDSRSKAIKHEVKSGAAAPMNTLQGIAGHYAGQDPDLKDLDWKQVALFNWGTEAPREVNRALAENVGCGEFKSDAGSTPLIRDAKAKGIILIPKPFKATGLATEKTHTITVKSMVPPVAIGIDKLSRWFIPEKETCDLEYSLEGLNVCADKVHLEVYGSNYSKCTDWNKGFGTFEASTKPVFSKEDAAATERGSKLAISDWKGKSNAAEGVLSLKTGGKDRFINVAFSPYTVMFRYFKDDADKKALLLLTPFWPQFDNAGKAKADSLKIEWEVKETTRLEQGMLVIWETSGGVDKEVFRKPLLKADLSGKKSLSWDGKYNVGAGEVKPENMPYRVQVQGHTGPDEEKGLALAAMHTEVRLFVHPKTNPVGTKDYDPAAALTAAKPGDPQTLKVSIGSLHAKDAPPADETKKDWFQYKLAEAGFHPGPVDGQDRPDYKEAMKEFQRSVPKKKTGTKYERLSVTGSHDDDTKEALKAMVDGHRRPWFGNPADKKDLPHKDDAARKKINEILEDHTKELMVWVDARHYYTKSRHAGNQAMIGTGDYHDTMSIGDKLVDDYDGKIVPRPWIPLQVDLPLLSKAKTLSDEENGATDEASIQAMRKAIGPLRVGWSFDEIGPDYSQIDTSKYNATRVRSKKYVKWATEKYQKVHKRKDTERDATYTNCPEDLGGIRPAAAADYFKILFGHGDKESLQPWNAKPDAATEAIVTVVHDHLRASQPAATEPLSKKKIGQAGIYFHPSRVGGDGYRVRAQVQFKKSAGYTFPNAEVLEKRYPKLPQAHTAKLRLWRRASIRAYVRWTSSNDAAHASNLRPYYHAAHVHFVWEKGGASVPAYRPTDLIDTGNAGDYDKYKTIIADRVSMAYSKNKARMKLSNSYSFPWYDEGNVGCRWTTDPDVAVAEVKNLVNLYEGVTWSKCQEGLLLDIAKRIEEKDGRLRGHVLCQFTDTRRLYTEKYVCGTCKKKFWFLEKTNAGGANVGATCSCGGAMRRTQNLTIGTYRCPDGHSGTGNNDNRPAGGRYNNTACPTAGCTKPVNCTSVYIEDQENPRTVPGKSTVVTYGVGDAGGVTWLCDSFIPWEWAHEMGHHRHLEHAANAPVGNRHAEKDKLHDSQLNPGGSFAGEDKALRKRWDRACVMSYVDSSPIYDSADKDRTYFCGKCILRGRGWKVESIAKGPGAAANQPDITLNPATKEFTGVASGANSTQVFQVKNTGTAQLKVTAVKIDGGGGKFTVSAGGGACNVAAGATHNVTVMFAPTDASAGYAELQIESNVDPAVYPGKNPLRAKLEGNPPRITVTPANKDYGEVAVGEDASQAFQVKNTGTARLNVGAPKLEGAEFAISAGAGSFNLAANATRNITVKFKPTSEGAKTGKLSFATNAPGTDPAIDLKGAGIVARIEVTPASHDYASVKVGDNKDKAFTIKNAGKAKLKVTDTKVTGADFELRGGVGAFELAANATKDVTVRFKPAAAGARTGTLALTHNDPAGSPTNISLKGEGAVPDIEVVPRQHDFTSVKVGAQAVADITVRNPGKVTLAYKGATLAGADFSLLSGAMSLDIGPGASTTIRVGFKPTSKGPKNATLSVNSDAPGKSPAQSAMIGVGT